MTTSNDLIEKILLNVDDLAQQIIGGSVIIDSLEKEPHLQDTYRKELLVTIQEYEETVSLLEKALLEHFEHEKLTNAPLNFTYHRLYKSIQNSKKYLKV